MDENKKQRNSEYVGVDEKYIPEEEKYVDEPLIKDQEKIIKTAKKFGKGFLFSVGISRILSFCLVIAFIVIIGSIMIKNLDRMNGGTNSSSDQYEIDAFNLFYEDYEGTQFGLIVGQVLDNAITNNSTGNKQVTVIYGSTSANDEEGLTNIKSSLTDTNKYDVSLNYDKDGYVNQITITDSNN